MRLSASQRYQGPEQLSRQDRLLLLVLLFDRLQGAWREL
jgi:hypothetical protein